MSSNISGAKRHRITVPLELENVESLSGDTDVAVSELTNELATFASMKGRNAAEDAGTGLPTFIINALIGKQERIEHDSCPFNIYIDLKQKAWRGENESQYLIVREGYRDLIRFLDEELGQWDGDSQFCRVITGTAGIGKSMFALLLARLLFELGDVVLLYYGSQFWAFAKEIRQQTKEYLDKEIEVDGTTIYFTFGDDIKDLGKLIDVLKRPNVITLRDCGKSTLEWLDLAAGRIIYFASSGQEVFLGMLESKTGVDAQSLLKYTNLWSAMECVWAAKLGLLQGFGNGELDIDYILEGYRRFGGSARNVLTFARKVKKNKVAVENLMGYPLVGSSLSKIQSIVDMQNSDQVEKSKSKAMVFHRSPVPNAQGHRVHFASTFLEELVTTAKKSEKVKVLNIVVAALSVSDGKQSAYGTLYEEEFHRLMFAVRDGESKPTALKLLGSHEPNAKKVTDRVPKENPYLDFARSSVLHFPGKSLANARLKCSDDPLSAYFHPLTSNFPTHDSFIVCKASCFFQANPESKKKVQEQMETTLANSVVLVGLQQTVSGSDDASDKPSHSVVGQHLKDHYNDFKNIMQQYHANINVLEEVVTVFVSPTESCRKMEAMPVLNKESKALKNAIPSFSGMAVQYCTVFEVEYIAGLMS